MHPLFYGGEYQREETEIGTEDIDGKDSVLLLMERGTIYQAEGEYKKSSMDFIRARTFLEALETCSMSEGAESWVVNDTVYSFTGAPFEQTLLHSMTALNHLALGNLEDGGVCFQNDWKLRECRSTISPGKRITV